MFKHTSVLLSESINAIITNPNGIYVDMTLGGGGHTEEIAKRLGLSGKVIGIDRDIDAINAATERLKYIKCQKEFVHGNYKDIKEILANLGIRTVDGIVCDLGVSSYQLDMPERGFSYQQDGDLDMRMDQSQELTAFDVVNSYSAKQLETIIRNYGEERWAKRIAEFIVVARQEKILYRTSELVSIIKKAIPAGARKKGPHPAKRTFQAIRIEVNGELRDLEKALRSAIELLLSGGRIGVISFHSLEDKIVKHVFRDLAKDCICPPEFPVCVCNHRAVLRKVTNAIRPADDEISNNPRARSATLRVAEKI